MVVRSRRYNPEYLRLAENLHNTRKEYISDKQSFIREYDDYLDNISRNHPIKKKKNVEKVWRDYQTLAKTDVLQSLQSGKRLQKKRRRKIRLADYDFSGKIRLRDKKGRFTK